MKTLLTILLTISLTCQGQDLKYASINIISSSIIAGVGSGIHKHSNETFGHAFVNGIWKGAIGGIVQFTSKKMIRQSAFENNYNWVWPARLVNSLGSSIVKNGCNRENILSSFYLDIWCVNLKFDNKIHCRMDLLTIGYATVLLFTKNTSFNLQTSLISGAITFNNQYDYNKPNGQSFANTIYTIKTNIKPVFDKTIFLHEIIHTFQYSESNYVAIYNRYASLNINFMCIYRIQNLIVGYNNNYFENEAYYFQKNYFEK